MWRRKRREQELERELRADLELEAQELRERGLSPGDAGNAARRALGNAALLKEDVRAQWGWVFLDRLKQDFGYALRGMGRTPAFTAMAVLSLSLGIGANTAIFTLLNAVLLKTLPVPAPEQLVQLLRKHPSGEAVTFPYPHYAEFRDGNQVFSGVAAFSSFATDVVINGETTRAASVVATGDFFSVLGVQARLGRVFTPEDDREGAQTVVAVISDEYWRRMFGGDPEVIGRTVVLAKTAATIVGVLPPSFHGMRLGASTDLYVPIQLRPRIEEGFRGLHDPVGQWIYLIGRLKPGIPRVKAQADLSVLFYRTFDEMVANMKGAARQFAANARNTNHLTLRPLGAGITSPISRFSDPLKILMTVVGIVLLIACANLANLLLARAAARRKEIAVRMAIGAGRRRVLRQLLTESLTLAAMGAAGGALFAWWGSRFLLRAASTGQTILPLDISPDGRVFAFTLAVSLVTALLFGLAPALRATHTDPQAALKSTAGAGLRSRGRLASVLVASQVALSLLLLMGAGLFVRSLGKLEGVDAGFRRDHLLLFGLNPGRAGYKDAALRAFYNDLLLQLRVVPGVRAAGLSAQTPLDGGWGDAIHAPGYVAPSNEQKFVSRDAFSPGYLDTMGATLLAGRDFLPRDEANAAKVAILNEAAARTYFGGENPIGKRFGFGLDGPTDIEVVGVVRDMKYRGLRAPVERVVYTPLMQTPSAGISVEVRTHDDPLVLTAPVRAVVGKLMPGRPIAQFDTMDIAVENQLMPERLVATLSSFFGALAALLAAVGLYGLTSYAVAQRTGEIGIRMALGADRADVQWQVMRDVLSLVAAGAVAGIAAATATSRVVAGLLYGVTPHDPAAIAAAVAVLMVAGLVAGWVPARRASRVDPMTALRNE